MDIPATFGFPLSIRRLKVFDCHETRTLEGLENVAEIKISQMRYISVEPLLRGINQKFVVKLNASFTKICLKTLSSCYSWEDVEPGKVVFLRK
jgi:hypothetical protein